MARRRGQQKGYVHLQGSMWYVAYREDALDEEGRIIRVRRNQRLGPRKELSKREAQRLASEILRPVNEQVLRPLSLVTVRQFVESRFVPNVVWALKHAGRKHYEYTLGKHVVPALGELKLKDVTSDHVQRLLKMKVEAGYSVQTAVHIRNTISAVFNHAKQKKAFAGDNPVEGVTLPEMTRRERQALTFEQGRVLLIRLSFPVREMALLSMTTSLNVAEMLGLRWKWLNLSETAVLVAGEILPPFVVAVRENFYRGEFGSVKAKSRRRNVPLSQSVVESLRKVREQSAYTEPEDLVFATSKGAPPNETNLLKRVLKPVGRSLGMPWLSWHVFRHTHATLGEEIGMALSDRQAQMGHGDVRMTLHYTHSDLERRRGAIETITNRLLGLSEDAKVSHCDTR